MNELMRGPPRLQVFAPKMEVLVSHTFLLQENACPSIFLGCSKDPLRIPLPTAVPVFRVWLGKGWSQEAGKAMYTTLG